MFPYKDNLFSLTSVVNTPIYKSLNLDDFKEFEGGLSDLLLEEVRKNMEAEIVRFFPEFRSSFNYKYYTLSVKTKPFNSGSDSRELNFNKDGRVISVWAGKINYLVSAEQKVKEAIL